MSRIQYMYVVRNPILFRLDKLLFEVNYCWQFRNCQTEVNIKSSLMQHLCYISCNLLMTYSLELSAHNLLTFHQSFE